MTLEFFISTAIGLMIIQNIVLTQFMGICPFLGVSKKRESAIGMSMAVVFVIVLASITAFFLNMILVKLDILFLQTIVFILVIASLVQFVEMLVKKIAPALNKALGVYLPLITTNCAVLGTAIKVVDPEKNYNFVEVLMVSFFTAVGFGLVMYIFSSVRERLSANEAIPRAFRGVPIALVVAAIMAILFSRFTGIV